MRSIKQLLWWIIAGSEGGLNRARIIKHLRDRPANANQLAEVLGLDYKTIRHHMDVLEKNNLVSTMGPKYGRMYFIAPLLENDYAIFEEIWEKIGKNKVNTKENRDVKK